MIYYEELITVIEQCLINLYETAKADNSDRYDFLNNNLYVGKLNPKKNTQTRFQVLFNVESFQERKNYRQDLCSLLLTIQILDYGTKDYDQNQDQTDYTYRLYEILNVLIQPQFSIFSTTSELLKAENKIENIYFLSKDSDKFVPRHGRDPQGVWVLTQNYQLNFQIY